MVPVFAPNLSMRSRLLTVVLAGLVCLGLTACNKTEDVAADAPVKKGKGKKGRFGEGGPVPVVAAKVVRKSVPTEVTAVGNVEAYSTVNVVPQISGQLQQAFLREGDFVKKGDKLFQIDPGVLEAQIAQAEANLARDQALSAQAEANLARDISSEKYARDQASRYMALFQQGIVSREQGEQFAATADSAANSVRADRAAVESAKAQIRADEANIRNLKVQIGYTTIYSPIDGRSGNITVKAGNIVNSNNTVLMTITQLEPIYVTFSVPETRFSDIRRFMASNQLSVKATPQDGSADTARGVLTFVDNNVDTTTGTIRLKGTFENSAHKLWPGEYVNVVLQMAVQQNALTVPNQAVQTGQDGNYVYVVKDDQTVEMRAVTPGARVDQDLVIDKGLEDGETVVTEGQLRLTEGSRVQIGGPGGPGGPGGRGGKGGRRGKDGEDKSADNKDGGGKESGGADGGGRAEGKGGGVKGKRKADPNL